MADRATVTYYQCTNPDEACPVPTSYDNAVNAYNRWSDSAKASADSDDDQHIIRVVLSDEKKQLNETRVLCTHQKP